MEYNINTLYTKLIYPNPLWDGLDLGQPENLPAIGVTGKVEISLIATGEGDIVVGATDDFLSQNFTTNNDGLILIPFKSGWINDTIRRFITKYKSYKTKFKVIINVDRGEFPPNAYKDIITYESDGDNFYQTKLNDTSIQTSEVTDILVLKTSFKTVEEDYLLAKKQYEAQLKSNIDISIDIVNGYEPRNFKSVITRLLEFQEGTINPSLEYTKTIGLDEEYKKLEIINKLILSLTKMYPSITIDDGEGIPYKG